MKEVLAIPHRSLELAQPSTITILEDKPGSLIMQRRQEAVLAVAVIPLGAFMIAIMGVVFSASGNETLPFAIPLSLAGLAGIVVGIRSLLYRQLLTLERGVLTVTERRSSSGAIVARGIEQFVVDAEHVAYWHKGLRWGTRYVLQAQTMSGSIAVFSGTHEEVRFVESRIEAALAIHDDPSRNVVTTAGS